MQICPKTFVHDCRSDVLICEGKNADEAINTEKSLGHTRFVSSYMSVIDIALTSDQLVRLNQASLSFYFSAVYWFNIQIMNSLIES